VLGATWRLPDADVVVSAFETGRCRRSVDVVLSATAFHWLDPALRVTQKSAEELRGGGALAVIETHHVDGGTADFRRGSAVLRAVRPDTEPGHRLPPAARIPAQLPEVTASDRFGPLTFRRHEWEASYPRPAT
jgi:trans-aconitate methyltransferase